jgi:hypothetical protein
MQSNDENLEKTLLVGVSRIAKSGYLSGLNNLKVFPMYKENFADSFGFTEDHIGGFVSLRFYDVMLYCHCCAILK